MADDPASATPRPPVEERESVFAASLAAMSEDEFLAKAESEIWHSCFANNNPRSEHHWKAQSCYAEAARRGDPSLYAKAYAAAIATMA